MSCLDIVHQSDDWIYDLEQINKERKLTRREYKQYQVLTRIRDEHYEIHLKRIEELNELSQRLGYCPCHKAGYKRLKETIPRFGGVKY
jgi:hypothetical protein